MYRKLTYSASETVNTSTLQTAREVFTALSLRILYTVLHMKFESGLLIVSKHGSSLLRVETYMKLRCTVYFKHCFI